MPQAYSRPSIHHSHSAPAIIALASIAAFSIALHVVLSVIGSLSLVAGIFVQVGKDKYFGEKGDAPIYAKKIIKEGAEHYDFFVKNKPNETATSPNVTLDLSQIPGFGAH